MTQHRISHVHVPVLQPADVIPHLGKPGHFKEGRSGRLVAETWFAHNGPSPAILAVLTQSDRLTQGEFLERKIDLGDRWAASQADVLALIGLTDSLAVIAVEGKVDEPFGQRVSEWLVKASADRERRLARLTGTLGLRVEAVGPLRYQFLHRAASAVYEARRYRARVAVLMVQSFDPGHAGLTDFLAFAAALGAPSAGVGHLAGPMVCEGVDLFLGWAAEQLGTAMLSENGEGASGRLQKPGAP